MSDTDIPLPHESPADTGEHATQAAPAEPAAAEPAAAEPAEVAPPLATLITAIRSAVAQGATPEARAAGATACRSILTVLEAKPGQPLAARSAAATPASPIASLLSQPGLLDKLAAMSREQLLDLLKQVTGSLPARTPARTTAGPRFHLIQVPRLRRPGGDA